MNSSCFELVMYLVVWHGMSALVMGDWWLTPRTPHVVGWTNYLQPLIIRSDHNKHNSSPHLMIDSAMSPVFNTALCNRISLEVWNYLMWETEINLIFKFTLAPVDLFGIMWSISLSCIIRMRWRISLTLWA